MLGDLHVGQLKPKQEEINLKKKNNINIVLSGPCVHCVLLLTFVYPLHLQGCECVGKHYLTDEAYFV